LGLIVALRGGLYRRRYHQFRAGWMKMRFNAMAIQQRPANTLASAAPGSVQGESPLQCRV
jgi:hypothetical protein